MPHTQIELLSWAKDAWEKITGKHRGKLTIVSCYPAAEIYDYKIDEMELVYLQFLLFRYWFRNKNDEGVFEFEPINIHGPEIHPLFIDAIKYDAAPKDSCSFNVLESTASDDKLLFRIHDKEKYFSSPCLRKYEIKKLILSLNRLYGPSLTKNKTEKKTINHVQMESSRTTSGCASSKNETEMNNATKPIKDALVINGITYKVVRTNNFAGLGPNPCELCNKKVRKLCQDKNTMPCELYHKGYRLAHFVKI